VTLLRPDGSFAYTPKEGFSGKDTFTYKACEKDNPTVCSALATATITVVKLSGGKGRGQNQNASFGGVGR
jgi:hypothetical protein